MVGICEGVASGPVTVQVMIGGCSIFEKVTHFKIGEYSTSSRLFVEEVRSGIPSDGGIKYCYQFLMLCKN